MAYKYDGKYISENGRRLFEFDGKYIKQNGADFMNLTENILRKLAGEYMRLRSVVFVILLDVLLTNLTILERP